MEVKKKHEPISNSNRYERFIKSRDITLESIHRKYQRAMDRAVDYLKERTVHIVSATHLQSPDLHTLKRALSVMEHQLDREFDAVERDATTLIYRMRGTIYALSKYGQAEAMVRALGVDQAFDLSHDAITKTFKQEMRSGGPIEHRVWLGFERLKRKIVDAYQMGILFNESTRQIIERVLTAFPRERDLRRPKKNLKHPTLKESERDDDEHGKTILALSRKKGEATGVIDSDLWQQMVADYTDNEIPFYSDRQPKADEEFFDENGKYEWEVEKETTQEFVDQVRNGEIDAANENGITDMMWLAVIDSHTDECCAERDGMTITEIESALDSGELDEDVCDATVPPAHFNCRCRITPMTKDLPEVMPEDNGDFESWLNTKT